MQERPHSRYTRAKTWAALYSQHINACYALVPSSLTNNSLAVIRCKTPEETMVAERDLLAIADECEQFYAKMLTPDKAPALLKRARPAVVLARSSDFYRYHIGDDHPDFRLVICGLHDSYLHLVAWETCSNLRYEARATRLAISGPEFARQRVTPTGHSILVGALICGDRAALSFLANREMIPERTARRIRQEVDEAQETRYRGRHLAFLTEAESHERGAKISKGLHRYYAGKRGLWNIGS